MVALSPSQQRRALTLVEVLVVFAIVAVLTGLLLAAVPQVRKSAERIECAANLHQIGLAFQMYRDNHGGQFPAAARVPSVTPELPSIAQALETYTEGRRIFRCPSDARYFAAEGVSYEYPGEFRGGVTLETLQAQGRASDRLWLLHDFDAVHGSRHSATARNFLYADGHVSP